MDGYFIALEVDDWHNYTICITRSRAALHPNVGELHYRDTYGAARDLANEIRALLTKHEFPVMLDDTTDDPPGIVQ